MTEDTSDVEGGLQAVVGRIYGTAPDDFVEERDRLAQQTRDEGDRELARAIGRLRKPTLAAWAVDQVALRDGAELQELFRLGDAARGAMQEDGRTVREAMAGMGDLLASLRDRAAGYLEDVGASPDSHLDDVEFTLRTAAIDPGRRADVAAGTLTRPLETSGFGALAGLELGTAGADHPQRSDARGSDDHAEREAPDDDRRELERERRELERRRDELRKRCAQARQRAEGLQDRADEAQRRADQLRQDAAEAGDAVQESEAALSEVEERLRWLAEDLGL